MITTIILLLLILPITKTEYLQKSSSERACQKYSAMLNEIQTFLLLGSDEIVLLESPHMAALGYETKGHIIWGCSGSIISERFILTAAHCLKLIGINEKVRFVRIGDIRLSGSAKNLQNFEVNRTIPHPEYKPPSVYHDIGLIELTRSIQFSDIIKPACLFSKAVTPDLEISTSGWGFLQRDREEKILHKIPLKLVDGIECSRHFESSRKMLANNIMEDKQICARSSIGEVACLESGSPLQTYKPDEKIYGIVGVTSFGKGCSKIDVPNGYSRVSYYIPWIETVVWPWP